MSLQFCVISIEYFTFIRFIPVLPTFPLSFFLSLSLSLPMPSSLSFLCPSPVPQSLTDDLLASSTLIITHHNSSQLIITHFITAQMPTVTGHAFIPNQFSYFQAVVSACKTKNPTKAIEVGYFAVFCGVLRCFAVF